MPDAVLVPCLWVSTAGGFRFGLLDAGADCRDGGRRLVQLAVVLGQGLRDTPHFKRRDADRPGGRGSQVGVVGQLPQRWDAEPMHLRTSSSDAALLAPS